MNFRSFLFSSACSLALCAGHAHAATPDDVVEFNSVADFRSYATSLSDPSTLPAVHLAAYYCNAPNTTAGVACPADGGEGLFLQKNGNSTSCLDTEDGGFVLVITKGTGPTQKHYCFYRQNLNGDIRQFGVTKTSAYDCAPTADGGHGSSGCTSITDSVPTDPAVKNRLGALFAAAGTAGLHKVSFAGLQLKTDHTVAIPDGMELDMGGPSPFISNNDTGLLDIPGTLFLTPGTTIEMGNQTSIHNGLVLPDWYEGVPADDDDALGILYGYRRTMVENGDTGLRCSSKEGCTVHDFEVDGFDTAFEIRGAPFNYLDNVSADGNVCFAVSKTGGNLRWSSTSCIPKITKGDKRALLKFDTVSEETTAGPYQHTCKVTLDGDTVPSGIVDGDPIWGAGVSNPAQATNINNRFQVHIVNATTLDLVGSSCYGTDLYETDTGDTVHATWKAGDRQLHVSGLGHAQTHDLISGASDLTGLHVNGIWTAQDIIILDEAPAHDGSADIRFFGGAFNIARECDPDNDSIETLCLELDAAGRVTAGDSDGGTRAGHLATGYMIGGPGTEEDNKDDKVAGFKASMAQVFDHTIDYHIQNSNQTHFAGAGADAIGTYVDPQRVFVWVEGDSNNASFVGGSGAIAGTGLLVDVDDPDECLHYVAGSAPTNNNNYAQFDVESGCLIAAGLSPGGGQGYIAHDASNVSFPGSYIANTDIFYEDATARANTSTLGAVVNSGQNNRIGGTARVEAGSLGVGVDPAADVTSPLEVVSAGTTTAAGASLTSSFTGPLAVTSTTGFPSTGIMLIAGEAIAYKVLDGTTLDITARGVWGTNNVSHALGDTISYFTLMDGHAANALPAFAVTSQGNIWWSGHTAINGAAPAVSGSAAGTGATPGGNDNAGRVTIGTSPSSTALTLTFVTPWTTAPVCFAMDESTAAVNPIIVTNETKNLVTFKTAVTPTAGDKVSYSCTGFK